MTAFVETDSRGRISLGRPNQRYLLEVEDDGTTVLTPAVLMAATEAAVVNRPDILAAIAENRAAGYPSKGRPKRPE